MEVTAKMITDLREKVGAGMSDCRRALTVAQGNAELAERWLRIKGIAKGETGLTGLTKRRLCPNCCGYDVGFERSGYFMCRPCYSIKES